MKPKYLPTTPVGRMWHLVEECSEVIKEAAKIGRFGPDTVSPDDCEDAGTTPRQRLLLELEDLEHAIVAVRADLK